MAFWITAAVISGLVGLTVLLGLMRSRPAPTLDDGTLRKDIQVYRDQLREVEKDVARGIIAEADAERLRVEISRRILEADRAGQAAPRVTEIPNGARMVGLATVPVIIAAAFLIYNAVGAPGYPDMPLAQRLSDAREARANRPAQAVAEAELIARATVEGSPLPGARPDVSPEDAELVGRLREALATRPDDLQGHRLLAVSEASMGNFAAAAAAQARVIELMGDAAGREETQALRELETLAEGAEGLEARKQALQETDADRAQWEELVNFALALDDIRLAHRMQSGLIEALGEAATADDHVFLADLMINAAGGYVSPEAERALETALRRDPRNPLARYFTGLMLAQTDRPDLAFRLWEQLLQDGPPDAPWIGPIRAQIEFVAMRAGINYTLPPAGLGGGPRLTDADIEAAREMAPEDRAAMIQSMVANLSQRLATQGGSAEDWARLIAAHGVLGNLDQASGIWTEAQAVFGARPEQLEIIRQAAQQAGVAN
ncbi:MAG: c-type cytochrome biogenesis protein CcmI [Alkalilacustris sp.]